MGHTHHSIMEQRLLETKIRTRWRSWLSFLKGDKGEECFFLLGCVGLVALFWLISTILCLLSWMCNLTCPRLVISTPYQPCLPKPGTFLHRFPLFIFSLARPLGIRFALLAINLVAPLTFFYFFQPVSLAPFLVFRSFRFFSASQ